MWSKTHTREISQSSILVGRPLVLHPFTPVSSPGCRALPPPPPLYQQWNPSDSLLTHPSRKHHFPSFFLLNTIHQPPGRCGECRSWLEARGPFSGPGPSAHPGPCGASWVQGALWISDPNRLREWVRKGWGKSWAKKLLPSGGGSLLHHLECIISIPTLHLLTSWADEHWQAGLAAAIRDIPAPLWAGTNQMQGWQKGQWIYTSDAITSETQHLCLKSLGNWV